MTVRHATILPPKHRASTLVQVHPRHVRGRGGAKGLSAELRGPFRAGLIIVALVFGVGGGWAATTKLAGAVIANGAISPENSRQTVQHLEGGIIRTILAKDGDKVARGQPLVIIEDLAGRADLAARRSRLLALAAQQERLTAERRGLRQLVFADPVLADRTDREVRGVIERESGQFDARQSNDEMRQGILAQRVAQSRRQIDAYRQQLHGIEVQRSLLREELETVEAMLKRGLERKPRLLGLQRAEAESLARTGALEANIAEAEEAITEVELQMAELRSRKQAEIDASLVEIVSERRQIEEEMHKNQDRLARSAVQAPVDGTIFNSRFKTPGGVIRPGEPILDIVPDEERLIVEAKLSSRDIDEVYHGQPTRIVFPTFPQRHMQPIRGKVVFVSADTVVDQDRKEAFYVVKIDIDRDHLREVAPNAHLESGMPAEAFLATSERTVLHYLTHPFAVAFNRSMREQ